MITVLWILFSAFVGLVFLAFVARLAMYHADNERGENYGAREVRTTKRAITLKMIGQPECKMQYVGDDGELHTYYVQSERQERLTREYNQQVAQEEENIRAGR